AAATPDPDYPARDARPPGARAKPRPAARVCNPARPHRARRRRDPARLRARPRAQGARHRRRPVLPRSGEPPGEGARLRRPVRVAADGAMMSETLYGLLIAGTLLVSLRMLDGPPRPVLAAALGALIGLAALTRAEALVLLPLLAWPLALHARPRRLVLLGAS